MKTSFSPKIINRRVLELLKNQPFGRSTPENEGVGFFFCLFFVFVLAYIILFFDDVSFFWRKTSLHSLKLN